MREFQYVVKHIPGNKNTVADALSRIRIIGTEKEEKWSLEYVHQQQDECQVLSQIKTCLKSKRASLKTTDNSIKPFEKELSRCFIGNDRVLRRKSIDGNLQIIIPQKLITIVLQMMHDDQGTLAILKHYSEHKRGIFGHECLPKLTNGARNARSANKDEIQFLQTGRRCNLLQHSGLENLLRWKL